MPNKAELDKLIHEQLQEWDINHKIRVLYDQEAVIYYRNNRQSKDDFRGFVDIDSYFESPTNPITVLIINEGNKYVYGTIAHELEHVKQLLGGCILHNSDRGKFRCEVEAYKAGRAKLRKYNKMLFLSYSVDSWGSLFKYFIKYELIGRIKKDNL